MEDGVPFLYTCWHVVTGYDRNDLRVTNALPKRAFLEVFLQDPRRQMGTSIMGGRVSFTLPLYDDSERPKKPLWYQDRGHQPHPDLNSIGLCVPSWHDAVKIPLSPDLRVSQRQLVSNPVLASNSMLKPGDEIYIVGFPYAFSAVRIPAKPGHHSDASEAIIPVDAGPVVKRWMDCRRCG
jgi:hypothetical protein